MHLCFQHPYHLIKQSRKKPNGANGQGWIDVFLGLNWKRVIANQEQYVYFDGNQRGICKMILVNVGDQVTAGQPYQQVAAEAQTAYDAAVRAGQ